MRNMSENQVEETISLYLANNSILETARATGMSTVKVRKILITEGLWESDTSIKIRNLLAQGLTTEEIAEMLYMSVKNVQAYMPYERGIYGGDELSADAVRAGRYRNRMKKAASMQVAKRTKGEVNRTKDEEKSERTEEMTVKKTAEFKDSYTGEADALRLHLELDLKYADEEEIRILKEYGSMKEAISRDILVPADITLHALNYAILRMFGWQNGHLHSFVLSENIFKGLTEDQFSIWAKMAGVYFRFPTENYEDIYWDDDYREGESIRSWMKKKYTGPYRYNGYGEHYVMNQIEVQSMIARWEEITVHEFVFGAEKQPTPYIVKLKEATVDQVMHAFADMTCHELLERLPLAEILCVKGENKVKFAEIREYLDSQLSNLDLHEMIGEYKNTRFKSRKKEQEFLEKYDFPVYPVTEQLVYRYDYGDGWKVLIGCENAYKRGGNGLWKDINGKIPDVSVENLQEVAIKHRPVCIQKDGIELVDDVGGIHGFCEMLQTIYECDMNSEEDLEERESILGWADMMGWSGRKISPKQTL